VLRDEEKTNIPILLVQEYNLNSATDGNTIARTLGQLQDYWARAIIGKPEALQFALICLLCRGHLLLEDVPGLGKTTLAKVVSKSLALSFKRLQCTPDLLPADITGVSIFDQKDQTFRFVPGPIFSNILLADEINRTSPRTQSALFSTRFQGGQPAGFNLPACKEDTSGCGTYNCHRPIHLEL